MILIQSVISSPLNVESGQHRSYQLESHFAPIEHLPSKFISTHNHQTMTSRFWTTDPSESVKLRMGHDGIAAEDPISICEGFNYIADKFPNQAALVYENKETKEWETVTYK